MSKPKNSDKTIILNGTGVNYSWHFPWAAKHSLEQMNEYKEIYVISGGMTAYIVYWAYRLGVVNWTSNEMANWSTLTRKHYGNNLLSGAWRLLSKALGSKKPFMEESQYWRAYEDAVKPEFMQLKIKDLAVNVRIPVHDFEKNEIIVIQPGGDFDNELVVRVSFAATAIPGVYPKINLGGKLYGDAMYSKKFLPWLKSIEKKNLYFENYNLLKNKRFANGEYIKICDHPNPKKMILRENMRFIFGMQIQSFHNNVRKVPHLIP